MITAEQFAEIKEAQREYAECERYLIAATIAVSDKRILKQLFDRVEEAHKKLLGLLAVDRAETIVA